MAKKDSVQTTLKVHVKEEQQVMTKLHFDPEDHDIRMSVFDSTLTRFEDRLNKTTKNGPRYTPEQRHTMMWEWLLNRIKFDARVNGEQFERATSALFREVFDEDPDKDFDDMGQEQESPDSVPVTNGEEASAAA